MANKLTVVITFVPHIFHRKITHLALITRKTTKNENLKCGMESDKEPNEE